MDYTFLEHTLKESHRLRKVATVRLPTVVCRLLLGGATVWAWFTFGTQLDFSPGTYFGVRISGLVLVVIYIPLAFWLGYRIGSFVGAHYENWMQLRADELLRRCMMLFALEKIAFGEDGIPKEVEDAIASVMQSE